MDSPNVPIAASQGPSAPLVPPVGATEAAVSAQATANVSAQDVAVPSPSNAFPSPAAPAPASERRIVTTLGADVIGSLQSLMGTVVIAIFVITFIVQAFQIPSESMESTLLRSEEHTSE